MILIFFLVEAKRPLLLPSFAAKAATAGTAQCRLESGNDHFLTKKFLQNIGLVVQLVRMPPCHGGGRGFESRPVRESQRRCLSASLLL